MWPIRRVFCVGRNYAEHTVEMGGDPHREPPFFFTKPADSVVPAAGTITYPPLTRDLQHEVELVIAIGRDAIEISPSSAASVIFGYAVGVDLTRRDLQNEAKELRRPWDWGKAFDESAPLSPIVQRATPQKSGRIWLNVNSQPRQDSDISEMIWPVIDVVSFASQSVALRAGDLIFTGTPAGVGTIAAGDVVSGGVEDVGEFAFTLVNPPQKG